MRLLATLVLVLLTPCTVFALVAPFVVYAAGGISDIAQCTPPVASVQATPEFDGTGTIRVTSSESGFQTFFLAGSACTAIAAYPPVNATYFNFTNVPSGTYGGLVEKDDCLSACAGTVVLANGAPPDLLSPLDHAQDVAESPILSINITHPYSSPMDITFYGRTIGDSSNDFTVVVFPDTQWYTYGSELSYIFSDMTQWIADSRDELKIAYVGHVGDVVQSHGTVTAEWDIADAAFDILENATGPGYPDGIPYGLTVGNHDQDPSWSASSAATANYNVYFGSSRFQGRSYYGGHYGSDNDNHYDLFSAGGMDFIVIHIECIYGLSSSSATVQWAKNLLQSNPGRRGIVVGHYIMNPDTTWSVYGTAIYNGLMAEANLFLMLCGHHLPEATKTSTYGANTVHTLLANWQDAVSAGGKPNGGDGFLRILRFTPSINAIMVHTYSATLNEYDTSLTNQFELSYDMGGSPAPSFSVIGALNNVTSGSNANITWPGRDSHTTYEWYAIASDGSQAMRSPYWRFTTVTLPCTPPSNPTNALANPSTICQGSSSTLTASVSGADINWYTGSCGGTLVHTGSPYSVSPSTTTTYYARARASATCESPGCDSVTVTVLPVPTATVTPIPGRGTGTVRVSSNLPGTQTFYLLDSACGAIDSWTGSATYHDFTGLPNGIYRGQVENTNCLSPCGSSTTLTNEAFPDFNGDGDVDQEDFGCFQACLTGSGVSQTNSSCANAKLDTDFDVDKNDFRIFLECMSGPNVSANPYCTD